MGRDTAVYFARHDYAGAWRRLFVDTVDSAIAIAVCAALTVVVWSVVPVRGLMALWASVFFCYFVLLKRSRFRTVGYRLAGVRIVNFEAARPSVWQLTLRLTFMLLGPANYIFDILWISSDANRQALRDKFAQTHVVRNHATPAGTGQIVFRYYDIFGYNCLFKEVERAREAGAR